MNGNKLLSCAEWAKSLTVLHEEDFAHTDLVALTAHLISCPACAAIRQEYLSLAHALAQDVSADPPTEVPPRLQRSLQSTRELINIPVDGTEKDEWWENIRDSFDTLGFDETLYHEVRILFNVQKPLEGDQHHRHS